MSNINKIIFLGTGTSTGTPVLTCKCEVCKSADLRDQRLRTSAYIDINELRLIIDCGPDFRQQLLKNNIDDFDALLITHGHRDHIAGLDDIRAFNYLLGKTIDIYADNTTVGALKMEFPYIFNPGNYDGAPKINLHIIDENPFFIGRQEIIPIPIYHGESKILGFKIGSLSYITDASFLPSSSFEIINNSNVLILNALRKSKHISHFSLNEALDCVAIIKPNKTFFTHISHFLGLHREVQEVLPENIFLAYDNLQVEF